ncbi:MAG: ATP-binding protein [Hamadaea sp.]|nr:ATP-binding protein [Hamadaea sp.]NUT18197.1 ATP-binding protein [Hamadaea sp.]
MLLANGLRAVVINGPRQSGKTTLLRSFQAVHGGEFYSLDDEATLTAVRADPTTFASYGQRPLIIDEIQRAGDPLVLAIKQVLDRSTDRGQFLLSGSTRFLTVPTLSESLAGRVGFIELWPLAVAERVGQPGDFCGHAFAGPESFLGAPSSPWTRDQYIDLICTGGYPEAIFIPDARVRAAWFDGYLNTVVLRDVTNFATIQHGALISRLLGLIAARSGGPMVPSDLSRVVELSLTTTKNYLSYLEIVFLLSTVPAWSTNLVSRIAKSPKAYVNDSGLAAHLLGASPESLRRPGDRSLGGLVETFVFSELTKLLSFGASTATIYGLRNTDGREVDFILEERDGRVVALEIKAAASVGPNDARHLIWLRDKLGDRFAMGAVVYLGQQTVPLGDRLLALPLSTLWGNQAITP